jgi:hypothetical protein
MQSSKIAWFALAFALASGAAAQTAAPAKKLPRAVRKAPPRPAPPPPIAAADDEQHEAADMTHYGDYACEFDQTVSITRHAMHAGYADVRFGKHRYTMKPVRSSTGALRLEDVQGRALLIQIPIKSMLMDAQLGRRLVDECVHENQRLARQTLQAQAAAPGIGIDPAKAVLEAEAAAAAASAAASAAATAASAAQVAASAAAEAASAVAPVSAASAPAVAASEPAGVPSAPGTAVSPTGPASAPGTR